MAKIVTTPVAEGIPFDNTTNGFTSEDVQAAIEEARITAQLPIVTSFAGLPSTPTINQQVFYTPFKSVLGWDGSHWVGPIHTIEFFGRRGRGNFPVWLHTIGRADAHPKGTANGIYMPEFTGSGGNSWKVYSITAKSDEGTTGDLELHKAATTAIPVYGTTGLIKTTFSGGLYSDMHNSSGVLFGAHSRLQCYFRRTAGRWNNLVVVMVFAFVAAGES